MGKPGQLGKLPNPKKPTVLRGSAGVWSCESSDRIRGRDGACLHVVGFLAGAGGWSITNVAAFSISETALSHPAS